MTPGGVSARVVSRRLKMIQELLQQIRTLPLDSHDTFLADGKCGRWLNDSDPPVPRLIQGPDELACRKFISPCLPILPAGFIVPSLREVIPSGPLAAPVLAEVRLKIEVEPLVASGDLNRSVRVKEVVTVFPVVLVVESTVMSAWVFGSTK
jgi:hypothetical protein